jgi:hypothetical protein
MAHILFQERERKVVMGKHKKIERMKEIDRRRKRREERLKQKAREKRGSQPSRSPASALKRLMVIKEITSRSNPAFKMFVSF